MTTDFRAIKNQAVKAAAARQIESRDASSFAAGYEIGLLQQVIIDLESRLAKHEGGDHPSVSRSGVYAEASQAEMLTTMIDDSLTDGEICTDAIQDALVDGTPIEFDGRFPLDDGSIWAVTMYLVCRRVRGAQPQPCGRCSGSGEGMTERSICSACGGGGLVDVNDE